MICVMKQNEYLFWSIGTIETPFEESAGTPIRPMCENGAEGIYAPDFDSPTGSVARRQYLAIRSRRFSFFTTSFEGSMNSSR